MIESSHKLVLLIRVGNIRIYFVNVQFINVVVAENSIILASS